MPGTYVIQLHPATYLTPATYLLRLTPDPAAQITHHDQLAQRYAPHTDRLAADLATLRHLGYEPQLTPAS